TTETYPLSLHDALPICKILAENIVDIEDVKDVAVVRIVLLIPIEDIAPEVDDLGKIVASEKPGRRYRIILHGELDSKCAMDTVRSEEHTSELQSRENLV